MAVVAVSDKRMGFSDMKSIRLVFYGVEVSL